MSSKANSTLLDTEKAPGVVLDLLLDWHPALTSVHELTLEIAGSAHERISARIFVEDAVAELVGSGLAHKVDRFVFASRTAIRGRSLTTDPF